MHLFGSSDAGTNLALQVQLVVLVSGVSSCLTAHQHKVGYLVLL